MRNRITEWTTADREWDLIVFPRAPELTAEEQWWTQQVELPLDINHTCRRGGIDILPSVNPSMGRREQDCPGCQYIRGYKDGQKHAE